MASSIGNGATPHAGGRLRLAALVGGLIVFILVAASGPFDGFVSIAAAHLELPRDHPDVLEVARGAQVTFALLLLMLIWWVTEAVPLPVTALLPGVLLPLLHATGYEHGKLVALDARAVLANYAHPVIYLFLGGFLLAGGMRKSGLDRRITLHVLAWRAVTRGPGAMLMALMAVTAALSMLISNTATAAMMIPIALGILHQLGEPPGRSSMGSAMMLGIGWSASIGGIATLIGSPPNLIAVGILTREGFVAPDFVGWLRLGLPVSLGGLAVAWLLLIVLFRPRTKFSPEVRRSLVAERKELGRFSSDEIAVVAIVSLALLLWLTHRKWSALLPAAVYQRIRWFGTYEIGLLAGLLLFIVPVERRSWRSVLTWSDTRFVDWGTLILFGGGLALSSAMFRTGVTDWIANGLLSRLGDVSPFICLAAIVLLVDYLTEITSNTAVTSMVTPLLIGVAPALGLEPKTVCVAAAMAASMAFMLPVATPPNALVYATGHFRLSQMVRAGCLMNLLGCGVVLAVFRLLGG